MGNPIPISDVVDRLMKIQICATCACHQFDWDAEDFICGNAESVHFGAWTASGDTCPAWKEKKRREQKKDR